MIRSLTEEEDLPPPSENTGTLRPLDPSLLKTIFFGSKGGWISVDIPVTASRTKAISDCFGNASTSAGYMDGRERVPDDSAKQRSL